MTPLEVYKDYLALRNHFTSSTYDYFKYQGKSSGSASSFEKRKDKFFFEKIAKHRDPHNLMLSNFSKTPKVWARDIAYSEACEQTYLGWLKRMQSLPYTVRSDCSHLNEHFDTNFIVEKNQHPNLLRVYCADLVSAETLCILIDLTGCMKHWDSMQGDVIWDEVGLFVRKYTPFINYNRQKVRDEVVDFFRSQ